MANLGKIVYLTEAQLTTLTTNGTITVNGQTIVYNQNDIYMTPDSDSKTWGNITGTLSDQTDLQTALNAKANTSAISTKVSDLINDAGYITATTYSTSEVATGDTWVDGKPIYRYVINKAPATAGDVVIGTLPSAPDNVISFNGSLQTPNGYLRALNYAPTFGLQYGVYVDVSMSDNKVHVHIGDGVGGTMYFTVVIEYTKATT